MALCCCYDSTKNIKPRVQVVLGLKKIFVCVCTFLQPSYLQLIITSNSSPSSTLTQTTAATFQTQLLKSLCQLIQANVSFSLQRQLFHFFVNNNPKHLYVRKTSCLLSTYSSTHFNFILYCDTLLGSLIVCVSSGFIFACLFRSFVVFYFSSLTICFINSLCFWKYYVFHFLLLFFHQLSPILLAKSIWWL